MLLLQLGTGFAKGDAQGVPFVILGQKALPQNDLLLQFLLLGQGLPLGLGGLPQFLQQKRFFCQLQSGPVQRGFVLLPFLGLAQQLIQAFQPLVQRCKTLCQVPVCYPVLLQ